MPSKLSGIRRLAAALACAAGLAMAGLLAPAASAAPATPAVSHTVSPIPYESQGCAGGFKICMHVTTPTSSGNFTIRAWVYDGNACFRGHYEVLYTPNGNHVNSSNGTWCHNNNYSHGFNLRQGRGQWCVIAWSTALVNIGEVCEDVT